MSAGTPNSIIERIRRVKALTESSNENEAAVAAAMLTKMLQEHDLSMADIEIGPEDPVVEVQAEAGHDFKTANVSSVRSPWRTRLAGIIAGVTFCDTIYGIKWIKDDERKARGQNPNTARVLWFIGRKQDAEVALYLYETLAAKIDALARQRTSEYIKEFTEQYGFSPVKAGGEHHPMVYRTSWLRGALATISHTLWDQYHAFQTSSPAAGAMIKVKDDAVSLYVKEQYPDLRKFQSSSTGSFNPDAYAQGKRDGAGIHAHRAMNRSTGTWQGQLGSGGKK